MQVRMQVLDNPPFSSLIFVSWETKTTAAFASGGDGEFDFPLIDVCSSGGSIFV